MQKIVISFIKKLLISFVLVIFTVVPAFAAQNWQSVGPGFFIDTNSIAKYDDYNKYSVWSFSYINKSLMSKEQLILFGNLKKSMQINSEILYSVDQFIIDCQNKEFAIRSAAYYDNNNLPVGNVTIPNANMTYSPIVPKSFGDNIYQHVCK